MTESSNTTSYEVFIYLKDSSCDADSSLIRAKSGSSVSLEVGRADHVMDSSQNQYRENAAKKWRVLLHDTLQSKIEGSREARDERSERKTDPSRKDSFSI